MPISAAFDAGRFAVLEGIARGTPLGEVLDDIVRLIESQKPGLLASILLVDGDAKCLREGAAPSLPTAYTSLLDGQPIGPKNGSCGTAAYLGQRVIVEDISTHPYWEGFAELALPQGLRACWSTPILAPDRSVIGTFAIYYRAPGTPTGTEIEWVDAATDLAAIAIAHDMSARSLRQSEARYRQLIDEAYEGVWTIDTSRRTTFANRRMGQILGEDPAALQGRLLLDFVHPDDREKVEQSVSHRLAGHSGHVEFRVRRKDGSERWVVSAASPIKNERGAVVGGLGLVRDVTERKHAETRAAALSTSLDQIDDSFYTLDADWRFSYCNLQVERVTGRSRADLIGKVIWEEFPESAGSILEREYRRAVAERVTVEFETYYEGLDLWVNVRAHPSQEGLAVYTRKVSEAHQAAERLREQASLLDNASDAIYVRDMEHRVSYWNKGAERLFGWRADEAIGKTITDLIGASQDVVNARAFLLEHGKWDGEFTRTDRSGRELVVLAHWTLVRDAEGRPKSLLAIESDITERKKLEQQFLRAQRLESIGTLAGGIAHDLNNVLTPISMAIEILKSKVTDDGGREMLGILAESAAHGTNMVKQVLSFARGVEGTRIQIDPEHLLKDVERIARDTFPKNIRTTRIVGTDLWALEGDATQLHQVLLNLSVNARDAMPGGGTLTLRADNRQLDAQYAAMNEEAHVGPYVMLRVEDTGTGIPANVVDKIFDPFFTTKEVGKGTGLGLSTSMAIARSHGGFMRVYSEPGKGTQLSVYLPAVKDAAAQDDVAEVELPRGSGETILVVDDERSIRQITEQTLGAFGYRVLLASDGAEAVAIFAQQHAAIDAVIMDMTMPTMDGASAIRVLEKIDATVPVVAASGIAGNEALAMGAGENAKAFLQKPYTADAVLNVLRQVLTGR
jgi:two-component system, cell cycle sensor histidine kinase and response regulator CckA